MDGKNTEGPGGGGEGEGSVWGEDGAELGNSEFKATVEELVWKRRKTKGRERKRKK